jgi:hypothetical protein
MAATRIHISVYGASGYYFTQEIQVPPAGDSETAAGRALGLISQLLNRLMAAGFFDSDACSEKEVR